jgi:hypothetical protein
MEPFRDDQMIADLRALRPTPRPRFAAELDARAAAGFPRRTRIGVPVFFTAMRTKRPGHPRRLLITAGGVAVVVIAVATAIAIAGSGSSSSESGSGASSGLLSQVETFPDHAAPSAGAAAAEEAGGTAAEAEAPAAEGANSAAAESGSIPMGETLAPVLHHRAVERSAEITLAADPQDVDDDA